VAFPSRLRSRELRVSIDRVGGGGHGWLAGGSIILLLGFGCQPEVSCAEDGKPCGGDPSGTWNVTNFCRDPVFAPPLQPTYLGQPVEMARQPSPTMASSDWCSSLFVGGSAVTSFTFPHDTLTVSGGQLTYVSDDSQQLQGTYDAVLDTSGAGNIDLSASCLTRSGATFTCDMVAAALVRFAALKPADPGVPCTDSPSEPSLCQFYYSYKDIQCVGTAASGCRCTYGVSFAGALHGRWTRAGSLITHSDTSKMLPSQADYCVNSAGGSMALWGRGRTSILNQTGVRTLKLQKTTPTPPSMP